MKEYDLVELVADKEKYIKDGVVKGTFGCVMSDNSIDGRWLVDFGEFYTGKDIAMIMVNEEDLLVHKFMPKDKYPKLPKGFTKEALKSMGYPFWETYKG